ncbi:MAG: biotin/lipoyl-containing protein, partial [Chitinophagales bacterium]
MQLEIKVPAVGESINEVTLAKWLKADGDTVQQDEVICELESEKATFELTAEKSGQLKIVALEGSQLKVGDVVCSIDTSMVAEEKATVPAKEIKQEEKKPEAVKEAVKETVSTKETYAKNSPSPAAEKLMKENSVAVQNGTGKEGRITKADVLSAIKDGPTLPKKAFTREERKVTLSTLRKSISKHLVAAKNTTAMLTTFN